MSNGIHYFPMTGGPSVDPISAVYLDAAPEAFLTAAAPAVSIATYSTYLDSASNNVLATLADGVVHGQMKKIVAHDVTNTVTVTLASGVSTSLDVITFTVIGDTAVLIWNEEDGYWRILELQAADGAGLTPTVA